MRFRGGLSARGSPRAGDAEHTVLPRAGPWEAGRREARPVAAAPGAGGKGACPGSAPEDLRGRPSEAGREPVGPSQDRQPTQSSTCLLSLEKLESQKKLS